MAGVGRLAYAQEPKLKLTEDTDTSEESRNYVSGKVTCEPDLHKYAELVLHGRTAPSWWLFGLEGGNYSFFVVFCFPLKNSEAEHVGLSMYS